MTKISALITLLSGIGLAYWGFLTPPQGEVSQSVLFFFSECLLYAGGVFGIKILFREEIIKFFKNEKNSSSPS